jgi:four helix bundle protein
MKTELEDRTPDFALRVIAPVDRFSTTATGTVAGRQWMKAGTSIGTNDREAGCAVSKEDFIPRIAIAEKEAAEIEYWLMICQRVGLDATGIESLLDESRQLLAILPAVGRNTKRR